MPAGQTFRPFGVNVLSPTPGDLRPPQTPSAPVRKRNIKRTFAPDTEQVGAIRTQGTRVCFALRFTERFSLSAQCHSPGPGAGAATTAPTPAGPRTRSGGRGRSGGARDVCVPPQVRSCAWTPWTDSGRRRPTPRAAPKAWGKERRAPWGPRRDLRVLGAPVRVRGVRASSRLPRRDVRRHGPRGVSGGPPRSGVEPLPEDPFLSEMGVRTLPDPGPRPLPSTGPHPFGPSRLPSARAGPALPFPRCVAGASPRASARSR